MRKRLLYAVGVALLVFLVSLVVWQGSFSTERLTPEGAGQTYLLWAVSTLIFILMVTLGFMLVRNGVKLYVERRSNREGSRIRTKLILGALALSAIPVFFLFLWSYYALNNTLTRWFTRPADRIVQHLVDVNVAFAKETQARAQAQAAWLASLETTKRFRETGVPPAGFDEQFCTQQGLAEARIRKRDGSSTLICASKMPGKPVEATAAMDGGEVVVVRALMGADLDARQESIAKEVWAYQKMISNYKELRGNYIQMMVLISLFILYVATWIAVFLSKQIGNPISALVEAAGELRRGNLGYRIQTKAIDELGTLVRAFNEMTSELQANEKELERRRQFTEAILESIPTGVISLSGERRIQRVNGALAQMFEPERVALAARIEDLFPLEDAREIHYLLNRAKRTGLASSQVELKHGKHTMHLAVTVSALAGKHSSGWVVVLEDTSELLRAQKATAWHEVARRIAHEMKNPLTPISLSADRIAHQLEKADSSGMTPEALRILRQCSLTIAGEVESVKRLVNEFSQFARFPAAQPEPSGLNDVIENALAVFHERLDGVMVEKDLAAELPQVSIDREQFKRVVVNLVDNAAEAMQDCEERRLVIRTQMAGNDTVELTVADSGHGISVEDRERLFLPYFSTKGRGTGLGLAIVHHILQEHGVRIRVEDHAPRGARFVLEVPVPQEIETTA